MYKITKADEYKNLLRERGSLPAGFSIGLEALEFSPNELQTEKKLKMNLSLILLDKPTEVFAGSFTKNSFPGAPVLLCKNRLKKKNLCGIVINNKIANVCIKTGIDDAESILEAASNLIGCKRDELMASSTGVIGWKLPVCEINKRLPALVNAAQNDTKKNAMGLSTHIMTTDSFPKLRSKELFGGKITVVAKGAGMIEPNMATMLCFIMTDIAISRSELREMLPEVVSKSFNRISVDSDQSTSDMVIAMSSSKLPCPNIEEFKKALTEACKEIASDIVRNGEGTTHVIRITVSGTKTEDQACKIGKAVVNSPLVKTAIAGNDPNVGRIISSIGDCCGNNNINIKEDEIKISMGGIDIFLNGAFLLDPEKERALSDYLLECMMKENSKGWPQHNKTVDINIKAGKGKYTATIIGSDLTHGYVTENADYRT